VQSPLPEESFEQLGASALGSRVFARVTDGYLVGFDVGEFGGSVWWFSPDGQKHYEVVSTGGVGRNPVAFAVLDGRVILVSGLEHLSSSEGSISHIHKTKSGKWEVVRTVSLATAAQAAAFHDQLGLLVLMSGALLSYDGEKVRRVDEVDFGRLHPDSIALSPSGNVYLGMRYVVARLEPRDGTVESTWLVPPTCAKLTQIPGTSDCRCEP